MIAMWTYYPELLGRAVPRYTSYPTAAEFDASVGCEDMEEALDCVPAGTPVSLYIHIPFCRAICWYCGCNTTAANSGRRLDAYLERLDREIALVAERLAGRGQIERIVFGGGSPNALSPIAFSRLMDRITTTFRCVAPVISVEIDPRGFDSDWAVALADCGVSRVSLGVQTFDPAIQAAIGRIQPVEDIRRTVTLLRLAGVRSLNFDLMYGLPGQSDLSLHETLAIALTMAPDRLAVFGYAHVPQLITRQRRINSASLPDQAARFRQAQLAHRVLTSAGYRSVGFDHFAVPSDALACAAADGTLRRNFQGFTEDRATTLIALGVSAISEFPDRLLQNAKDMAGYRERIDSAAFATMRGCRRTEADRLRGTIIEDVLTRGTADLAAIPAVDAIHAGLAPFEARGLLSWEGSALHLSESALPYARAIASTIDDYRGQSAGQFSHAV